MRITVNLSQIFRDHRLEAKIFIKQNVKRIKDLEDHISKIFHIDNFCLKCEGHYLPPLEDVQLLRCDDVIWVTPLSGNKSSSDRTLISLENSVQTEDVNAIKKTTKKRKIEELSNTDESQSSIQTNKRCKDESNSDNKIISEEKRTLMSIQEEIVNAEGCESSGLEKKCDKDLLASTSNHTSTDPLENQEYLKKELEHVWGSHTNKSEKINIIKTVVISNKNNTLHPSLAECFSIANLNVSAKKETCSSANVQENSLTFKNNVESYNCTSKFQTAFDNNNNTNLETVSRKRKGKRNRKKKHLNKVPESTDTLTISIYDFLTNADSTQDMNLKDDSKDQGDTSIIIVDDDSLIDREEEATEELVDNENKLEKHIVFKEKQVSDEFILEQPIMQNIQPKHGDVIGFKVHKVCNGHHASEISSIIVGKVVTFNPASSEVTWDIIYGQDQCFPSQDKSCVLEDVPGNNSTQFHCKWSDLLDPRLLP